MASDVPAILKYTRNVYYIGNLEFAKLTPGEDHFYNLDGDEIEKQTTELSGMRKRQKRLDLNIL